MLRTAGFPPKFTKERIPKPTGMRARLNIAPIPSADPMTRGAAARRLAVKNMIASPTDKPPSPAISTGQSIA